MPASPWTPCSATAAAPAGGLLGKLLGAGKRLVTGESLFTTVYTNAAAAKQRVAFAAPYPGKILPMDLRQLGGMLICQKDAFLCAARGVSLGIAFQQKLSVGFFGGEGFIMQKLEGDGLAFVHAGGTVVRRELQAGQTLMVDTGCVVAYTAGVSFEIQYVGKIKTALFGGEGLFFAKVTGPGTVWLQSLPFSRLASRVFAAAPQTAAARARRARSVAWWPAAGCSAACSAATMNRCVRSVAFCLRARVVAGRWRCAAWRGTARQRAARGADLDRTARAHRRRHHDGAGADRRHRAERAAHGAGQAQRARAAAGRAHRRATGQRPGRAGAGLRARRRDRAADAAHALAGTISMPEPAFEAMLEAAARSLRRARLSRRRAARRPRRLPDSLERVAAAAGARPALPRRACRVHALAEYYRAAQEPYAWPLAAHGLTATRSAATPALADTSLMLALDPALVRLDVAASRPREAAGDGVSGDPRRASAELGRLGVDHIVAASVAAIRVRRSCNRKMRCCMKLHEAGRRMRCRACRWWRPLPAPAQAQAAQPVTA